jgi:hypothetical protein
MNLYVRIKEYMWKCMLTYYMLLAVRKDGSEINMEVSESLYGAATEMLATIKADESYHSEKLFTPEYDPKLLVEDSYNE